MRLMTLVCALLLSLLARPAAASYRSVTFYLDGARVEQEVSAVKGYLGYPLPDSMSPGSLRVSPSGGGSVLRVEVVTGHRDRRSLREVARLQRRKGELLVRLEELASREEIFTAAAKSQSGKALRKSKANPDPLQSLQQGTEYALAQLDDVHRNRQKVRNSLEALEQELAAARKGVSLARIWISGKRARVSYLVSNRRWTPCYNFRWSGVDANGELLLHARLPRPEKGVLYLVSSGTTAEGLAARKVRGDFPLLSRHPLTLRNESGSRRPPPSFVFDRVEAGLPPGEAAAFWGGEYLGSGLFSGAGGGELSLGRER